MVDISLGVILARVYKANGTPYQGLQPVLVDPEDAAALKGYRWFVDARGYVVRHTKQAGKVSAHYLHREIMGFTHGDGRFVDHINRNRLDNRRCNLREVTAAQNRQNLTPYSGTSSKYRGVHYESRRDCWIASGCVNRRSVVLGSFTDEKKAAAVALAFRQEHMPFCMETSIEDAAAA